MLQLTVWREFLGYSARRRRRKPKQTSGLTELVSQRLKFREVARYCRAKYWRREEKRGKGQLCPEQQGEGANRRVGSVWGQPETDKTVNLHRFCLPHKH